MLFWEENECIALVVNERVFSGNHNIVRKRLFKGEKGHADGTLEKFQVLISMGRNLQREGLQHLVRILLGCGLD